MTNDDHGANGEDDDED